MFGKNPRTRVNQQSNFPKQEILSEEDLDVRKVCILICSSIFGGFALGFLTTFVP